MKKLKETAAGGATTAHSIAVRTDGNRLGGMQKRPLGLKDFMVKFYNGVQNRNKFHKFQIESSISTVERLDETANHPFQYNDAMSKFKGMEADAEHKERDTISFGIEDDSGAFMKITVPISQAEQFETRVAQSLAEVQEYKKTGRGSDKSLAELLYELKDEFTIVNAEFPTIPKDALYNASQIDEQPDTQGKDVESDEMDMGDEDLGDEDGMGDEEGMGDEGMGDEDLGGEEGMGDEEIGDDFDEESGETSKEDLLKSVIAMIKSNNDKEVASYKAEEEKAKARQMELAMKSSQQTQAEQEQMVAAQAEMEAHKDAEKKAKELADMVKFKYKKKKGLMDSQHFPTNRLLIEFDSNETPGMLRRAIAQVGVKWQPEEGDDPETRRYKNQMMGLENRNLRLRMRAAQMREKEEQRVKNQENEEIPRNPNQRDQQNQQSSNQMNARPNSTQARQQAQQQPNGGEL